MPDVKSFSIPFDSSHIARAIRVPADYPLASALDALRLPPYRGVIVIHGGAGNMEPAQVDAVRRFLTASLAPFAEEQRLLVVDGGTRSGTMAAMGDARREVNGTFPLLGVTPYKFAGFPGRPASEEKRWPLEPSHTHFILVEGDEFGVESNMLVGILQAVEKPGMALIINGGEIVFKEAQLHAQLGNPLVTVRGSGRVADELADPNSERRAMLPSDTQLEIANLQAPDIFSGLLGRLLG